MRRGFHEVARFGVLVSELSARLLTPFAMVGSVALISDAA